MPPVCSFLIPVRDAASSLGEALESALAQRCAFPFEVVVVDDGSADASPEIAAAFVARDARVRALAGPGTGLVAALNAGLEACRGEWVARLDADDRAAPQRLARQLALAQREPELAVVDGRVAFFRRDGAPVAEGMRRYADWVNAVEAPEDFRRLRFREACVVHPAATMRRDAVLALGGYRDVGPEDFELWLRMHDAGLRFGRVPEVLVEMCDHERRLTRRSARYARAAFVDVALEAMLRGPLASVERFCLIGGGRRGRAWQRGLASAGRAPLAIVDVDPARIGARRGGVPVLAPEALAELDVELGIVVVGGRGSEPGVRRLLAELRPAWREGSEYFFVVA